VSLDTTFHPIGASVSIVSGVPQQLNGGNCGQLGVTTFRVSNTGAAAARFTWGSSAAGTPVPTVAGPNTMYLQIGDNLYIEVPPNSWFNIVAAGTMDVIGGIGGVGG